MKASAPSATSQSGNSTDEPDSLALRPLRPSRLIRSSNSVILVSGWIQNPANPHPAPNPTSPRADTPITMPLAEILKPLFTTLSTIVPATAIFVIGQILTRFVPEPIQDQARTV